MVESLPPEESTPRYQYYSSQNFSKILPQNSGGGGGGGGVGGGRAGR
jgi:hypothetical protein